MCSHEVDHYFICAVGSHVAGLTLLNQANVNSTCRRAIELVSYVGLLIPAFVACSTPALILQSAKAGVTWHGYEARGLRIRRLSHSHHDSCTCAVGTQAHPQIFLANKGSRAILAWPWRSYQAWRTRDKYIYIYIKERANKQIKFGPSRPRPRGPQNGEPWII